MSNDLKVGDKVTRNFDGQCYDHCFTAGTEYTVSVVSGQWVGIEGVAIPHYYDPCPFIMSNFTNVEPLKHLIGMDDIVPEGYRAIAYRPAEIGELWINGDIVVSQQHAHTGGKYIIVEPIKSEATLKREARLAKINQQIKELEQEACDLTRNL